MTYPAGWDDPELAHMVGTDMSARSVDTSRQVMHEAWRRIAESRGRISRRQRIAGGSGDALRDEIRRRLAAGTLPRTAGHAWIGAAQGDRRCACCGAAIAAPASECVVRDRVELHAHAGCFRLWVEESSGPAASGWWAPTGAAAPRPHTAESPSDTPSSIPRRWRAQ
jgi:hypothetical protein